jgi:pantothenate kinase type III
MPEIGNSNLVMARLDPDRLKLFGKLRRKREKNADVIRRAIDALAERELKTDA